VSQSITLQALLARNILRTGAVHKVCHANFDLHLLVKLFTHLGTNLKVRHTSRNPLKILMIAWLQYTLLNLEGALYQITLQLYCIVKNIIKNELLKS